MDCKYPDFYFSDISAPLFAKDTEDTLAEDIPSKTNPFEEAGDSSQTSEMITEMNKSVSLVVIMRRSQRTMKLPVHLKDYELK